MVKKLVPRGDIRKGMKPFAARFILGAISILLPLADFLADNASAQTRIYWSEKGFTPRIRRAKISDTSDTDVIYDASDGVASPQALVVGIVNDDIFWVETSPVIMVMKGNLDGTEAASAILTYNEAFPELNFGSLDYIALDEANGKLYLSDRGQNRIQRCDLDGSALETVLPAVSGPEGIALNSLGTHLFRTDSVAREISSLNIDAQTEQVLYNIGSFPPLQPTALTAYSTGGEIFWVDNGSFPGIYSATTDGFGTITIKKSLDPLDDFVPSIVANEKDGSIYFVKRSSGTQEIAILDSVDPNGSITVIDAISHLIDTPHGLAIEIGCPSDPDKDEPGACGCGTPDTDVNEDGTIDCLESAEPPPFTPDTELTDPPEVTVVGRKATITLQEFSDIVLSAASGNRIGGTARRPLVLKYQVVLRNTDSRKDDIRRKTTKRNSLTFKDLTPGSYSVKYRVQITRGKSTVDRSNFSPAASFDIIP